MENSYKPKPLETDQVALDRELLELVELLAENAHNVWASQRLLDGWVFGPARCDELRRHPCLVPYSQLSDEEKTYDRNSVLGTIRAILALGFTISRCPSDAMRARKYGAQDILRTPQTQVPAETGNLANAVREVAEPLGGFELELWPRRPIQEPPSFK